MTPPRSPRSRDERAPRPGRPGARPAPRARAAPARSPSEARAEAAADAGRVLARQPWSALRPLLPAGTADPERVLSRLRTYARVLLEWNRGVSNLVSRHDEPRLVERHLAESLAPAALLQGMGLSRVLDFGSGAGLPAIPLALAGIGANWTLVESRRNKTLFIRKAIQDLELSGFVVECARLETLVEEGGLERSFDGFTSRATMAVGPTLTLASAAVTAGGRACLWKGSGFGDEMSTTRASWEPSWEFEAAHPILSGPNCVAVFVRK